jgi:hypothetical protein
VTGAGNELEREVEAAAAQLGWQIVKPESDDTAGGLADWCDPVDWPTFLTTDTEPDDDWLIEPIVPVGRHIAIWARAKVGKSLLLLDACAALATGNPVLGGPAVDPVDVIYVDMENSAADVRSRMFDFGYTAASDLKRLHYFHMPALPSLDTELGGKVLAAQVERFDARLVVVDTTASAAAGPEDKADTYRDFYRHTGRPLRDTGTALARLDHGGKERAQGQRGSSAKDDDVDVVLELTQTSSDLFTLRRTRSRIPWVPAQTSLRREEEPRLRHVLEPVALPDGALDAAADLDRLGVPVDASVRDAETVLRDAGNGRRRGVVAAALKYRRRPR